MIHCMDCLIQRRPFDPIEGPVPNESSMHNPCQRLAKIGAANEKRSASTALPS
jgi:hypothetical protein